MSRIAVKSLWARKVRALATTLAVVVGVAFVAGTYILTDTTFAAFENLFGETLRGTDVVITARSAVEQETEEVLSFDAALLPRVRDVRGVRLAAGVISTPGGIFDREGESIGAPFAPKFISSRLPAPLEALEYVDGRPPGDPSEASIDEAAAQSAGLEIGDTIRLASVRRARDYRLVGLTGLPDVSFGGGASIAVVTLPEAQRITGKEGEFDQISVAAEEGVSPGELRRRLRRVTPPSLQVETAAENAARNTADIREDLGFLRPALLVFAFVALFVGAFLIFNTFSITVAQRIGEFGMLRTLGASRRQLLRTVTLEALAIGTVGALAGLAGGYGIAAGLDRLFDAAGFGLPSTALVTAPRTIAVSLAIGIGVTLLSSLVPAVRSTRVPPIAALGAPRLPSGRGGGPAQAALAAALALVGMALLLAGLFGGAGGGDAAGLVGGGAVAVILGVSLFSPRLVRPLASLAGLPLQWLRSLTGRLARENTQRNPARTAVTAAALMIGLAVVAFVTVFAAGLKSSIAAAVDESIQGELVIRNEEGFLPISPRTEAVARAVPGVESVSALRNTEARLLNGGGGTPRVSSLPRDAGGALDIEWADGGPPTLRRLANGEVILDESFAADNGFATGDTVRLLAQTGRRLALRVAGSFEDRADLLGSALVTQRLMARAFGQRDDSVVFVELVPGFDPGAVQRRLGEVVERAFPIAAVSDRREVLQTQSERVDELVNLIYALLGLAVLVSLFGIANTLGLSIHERTRELGMLRAIGMSRRQVRTMVRYEAVITALIGAVLGMALGLVFATLIAQPLGDEGFTLSYPVGTLLAMLVFAALAGVVAAIPPARRASRLDVLDALHYE